MGILNYANEIYEDLQEDLELISLEGENRLVKIESSFYRVNKTLGLIKEYLEEYQFKDEEEEILFFKFYMTKLLKDSIFFEELFNVESGVPLGSKKGMKSHYRKELEQIQGFQNRNRALFNYHLMQKSHFDRIYFLRNVESPLIKPTSFLHTVDQRYYTVHTMIFSRIMATIKLSEFIQQKIQEVDGEVVSEKLTKKFKLTWTAPKVQLVELVYGLKASGVFNHGRADIKEIAQTMEILFGKEMKDYYRTFQEIRIRKKNRTVFLDLVKEKIEAYMEESEGLV
ncbi:RteC domain-containing protein [Algoriphagus pacificus]|uniref:RteC domain-containing protein n=1 Tax=Algoriphagus pacificus TaxID=2811234 RepID=A0ABS3CIH8_9BACT|nr:RteC domain-containing protein [Algoriphagus pacificus]MBN7816906.1 RteC domain-containing protein [Algoriphagus pacificus]